MQSFAFNAWVFLQMCKAMLSVMHYTQAAFGMLANCMQHMIATPLLADIRQKVGFIRPTAATQISSCQLTVVFWVQLLGAVFGRHLARAAPVCHQSTPVEYGMSVSQHGVAVHCPGRCPLAPQQSSHCVDLGCASGHDLLCPHVW